MKPAIQRIARCGGKLATGLLMLAPLSGCVVVGVSNRGVWFIWPRGFGLLFTFAILLILLLRRRR